MYNNINVIQYSLIITNYIIIGLHIKMIQRYNFLNYDILEDTYSIILCYKEKNC